MWPKWCCSGINSVPPKNHLRGEKEQKNFLIKKNPAKILSGKRGKKKKESSIFIFIWLPLWSILVTINFRVNEWHPLTEQIRAMKISNIFFAVFRYSNVIPLCYPCAVVHCVYVPCALVCVYIITSMVSRSRLGLIWWPFMTPNKHYWCQSVHNQWNNAQSRRNKAIEYMHVNNAIGWAFIYSLSTPIIKLGNPKEKANLKNQCINFQQGVLFGSVTTETIVWYMA